MKAGIGDGVLNHHSLQQELRAVIREKAHLSVQVEELQCELARLRACQASSQSHNGIASHHHMEREKKKSWLSSRTLFRHENNQQETTLPWVSEPRLFPITQQDCCIESVQIPLPELLSAVRTTFKPGVLSLGDGISVTLEYEHDYVVVRGSQPGRSAFMTLLLNVVLKYMEGAFHGRLDGKNHGRCAVTDLNDAAASSDEAKKGKVRDGESVTGKNTSNEDNDEQQLVHQLRRSLEMRRVECERAQVALHEAENECTLKDVILNTERTRHIQEVERFEERVRQLESDLGNRMRETGEVGERRKKHAVQSSSFSSSQRMRVVDVGEPASSSSGVVTVLEEAMASGATGAGGRKELHECQSQSAHGTPHGGRSGGTIQDKKINPHMCASCCAVLQKNEEETVLGERMILLQRETELLREEKERLSRHLKTSISLTQQQRDRLERMESAVANFCRTVLNTSDVAAAAKGEGSGYETVARPLLLHNGGVDTQRVHALVHSLSSWEESEKSEGTLMEKRLADLEALLDLERRAMKATLEFAVCERDAALLAKREEVLLRHEVAAEERPMLDVDRDGAGVGPSSCDDWKGRFAAVQKENVALRIELYRCFEEMKQIGRAVERSHMLQEEAQGKLRLCERRLHEKDEMTSRLERQHMREMMTARERENALEMELQQQRHRQRKQQQLNWMEVARSLDADVMQRTPQDTTRHLVQTPEWGSRSVRITAAPMTGCCAGGKEGWDETGHVANGTADLSAPAPGLGMKKGTGALSFPSSLLSSPPAAALRKENFEGALDAIHPRPK